MSIETMLAITSADSVWKTTRLLLEAVGSLAKEAKTKRQDYLTQDHDPTAAIERKRLDLIQRLTTCQNRILFEVSDADLVTRLVLFALEQTTAVYGASRETEFGQIEMAIGQLEGMLARNDANLRARASHRTLAVWVVGVIIAALIALIASSPALGISAESVIPLIQVPLPVVIWSSVGSLGAMLYRFNNSADAELADPLRWSFTRPLTGVLMGIITYMVFKIGALVLQPGSPTAAGVKGIPVPEVLLWLAAFLAGFSDRFADAVLRSLAGRLGGDKHADLITLDRTTVGAGATLNAVAERLAGWTKRGEAHLAKALVTANDADADQVAPKPEQQVTPKPEQQVAPKREQQVAPKPEQQVAPKPEQQVAPKPEQQVAPKPEQQFTPKPEPQSKRKSQKSKAPDADTSGTTVASESLASARESGGVPQGTVVPLRDSSS
jgi:hypothetical protein